MTVTINKFSISDLPSELLAGIGEIVARWGFLEFQLGVIVRQIAALPKETGRVITMGPSLNALCGMIRTFADTDHWVKDPELRKAMAKLVHDVQKRATARNEYAHGVFGTQTGGGQKRFVRHLMRGSQYSVSPDVEEITVQSLKTVADEAKALWDRAQVITQVLKGK